MPDPILIMTAVGIALHGLGRDALDFRLALARPSSHPG